MKRAKVLIKRSAVLLICVTVLIMCTATAQNMRVRAADPSDDEYPVREGDFTSAPRGGSLVVAIEGSFVTVSDTEKQDVLDRINEIRLEACKEHLVNPEYSNKTLSESDYVPIKWSMLLEMVAAMRAVEASVYCMHGRIGATQWGNTNSTFENGYGIRACSEVIAWNWNYDDAAALVEAVDQWYEEKYDYVNETPGAVTGHYTALINPNNLYIGLSGFWNPNMRGTNTVSRYTTVAAQFARPSWQSDPNIREDIAGIGGRVAQKIEVAPSLIGELSLSADKEIVIGQTSKVVAGAVVKTTGGVYGTSYGVGNVYAGLTWESSDPSVISVSVDGTITAVSKGTATITASVPDQNVEASITITADTQTGQNTFMPGDVNGDGSVDNQDVVALFRYVSGGKVEVVKAALDPDGDGNVTNIDVVILFRYVSGANVGLSTVPYTG
ncbi:MAG: Ig-like domain-containing protein [Clostridia bacterium]|nr:Ig-like domain-containing protein [Clostridia bacterium]